MAPSSGLSARPRDQVSASKQATPSRLPTKPSLFGRAEPQTSSHAQLQLNLNERTSNLYQPVYNAALHRARAGQADTRDIAKFGTSRHATTVPTGGTERPRFQEDIPDAYIDVGVTAITPTPSLVSGSTMSPQDSPKAKVLRRKPSVIGTYISRHRTKDNKAQNDTDSLQRTAVAVQPDLPTSGNNYYHANYYQTPDLSMFPKSQGSMQEFNGLPPPTPLSDPSSFTPSLRYTESPSTFSHATTPTTTTSYSPLVAASPQIGVRAWYSPSKSSIGFDHSRPSSRKQQSAPDEPYGHPFFRESAVRSVSPRKQMQENVQSSPSFRQRSKLTKARPVDITGVSSNTQAQKSVEKVHPPELAHLLEETSPIYRTDSAPSRPSRDGTPNLASQQAQFPVVYSNLSSLPLGSNRRQSPSGELEQDTIIASPVKTNLEESKRNRETSKQIPKSSSKVSLASSGTPTSTPAIPPAKSPSTKSTGRFGFFSRRAKVDETRVETPPKQPKKGPVAGTGHEGYGKHAARPRHVRIPSTGAITTGSSSSGSAKQASFDRKRSSTDKADSDIDDFLSQRLKPIYLRGDGINADTKNSMDGARTDSRQSTIDDEFQISPTLDSPKTSHTSQSSMDPPSFPRSRAESTANTTMKNIASRITPSQNTSPNLAHLTGLPPPSPLGKSQAQGWSSETSLDSIPPVGRTRSKIPFAPRHQSKSSSEDSSIPRPEAPKREVPAKRKKANWFGFGKSPQRGRIEPEEQMSHPEELPPIMIDMQAGLPVQISHQGMTKPVAHYAMMDSTEHVPGLEDIEKYMEEAKLESDDNRSSGQGSKHDGFYHARTTHTTPSELESEQATQKYIPTERADSSALTRSAPTIPAASQAGVAQSHSAAPTSQIAASRPSRLPQVGRIPKVVSTREPATAVQERSFSRPFAASPERANDNETSFATDTTERPDKTYESPIIDIVKNEKAFTDNIISTLGYAPFPVVDATTQTVPAPKMFAFTTRKGSCTSYSSSSGASFFPTLAATAVMPGPGSPLSEDEVWTEYDDLLDNVLSPTSTRSPSTTVLKQIPTTVNLGVNSEPSGLPIGQDVFARDFAAATKASSAKGKEKEHDIPIGPLKPGWSQMNEDLNSSARNSRRATYSGSERASISTSRSSGSSNTRDQTLTHKRSTSLNQISEIGKSDKPSIEHIRHPIQRAIDPQYMANLRFGALMTSKWLSFGRVLFSPVHLELHGPDPERILVIDGLGKDWSYYCALTYPDISVYSLGPSPSSSPSRQSLGGWQSLPNHRHFAHSDWTSNFPFPKSFFAAVVFRFPAAMRDLDLRCTLCECKRVLRPGGYIEVSALDLDLNNMGNIARKAIREMKMKIQDTTPEISLKQMSDQIQFLLGRRGFENLNRCIVGVPAAGMISNSRENSCDEKQKTLTELVHDTSQEGDESITKMVSRVGRWWYTRCYEMGVLPNGDLTQSLWNDKTLLRECERLSTTFNLLVCYAQKPSVTKRRTVSL